MTATVALAPIPKLRFSDNNGNPAAGFLLFTYASGSTTKQNTYTDSTGVTQNANPVILDSRGESSAWTDATLAYKYVLAPPWDTDPPTSPVWTVDNVPAANGAANALSASLASTATGSGVDRVGGSSRVVSNITALRALVKSGNGNATVIGYYAAGDGGGGTYWYDSTDTTTVDNGGSVIVATDGGRWKFVAQTFYTPKQFGAKGDGTTNDYAAMVAADIAAAAKGLMLSVGNGKFVMNTSYAFTSFVGMFGGVLSGTGTASFPAGFIAPAYYCFDCLVGAIKTEVVLAEWFGARQTTATPTNTSQTTVGKAWNAWPSFVYSGGVAQPNQNYGNAAFLGANLPFADSDTWDFIAIQRALWSIGTVTTLRGEVRLLAGTYTLNRAVRWVGSMSSTMRGAGRTKTVLTYNNYTTHEVITVSSGSAKALLDFYVIGPDPTFVADLCLLGPNSYTFGSSAQPLYLASIQGCNGLTLENCWITTGDAGVYLDSSSSDIWVRHCTFEYGANQLYGFDAGSWIQIEACGFWWSSGTVQTGVNVAGYALITGCTFVSLDLPYQVGLGSQIASTTLIQRTTGYRSTINGRTITRHIMVPVSGSVVVATVTMAQYSALTTRMRVGGIVQGVGGAGLYRELAIYRDNAAPVATAIVATTKFGNVTAQGLIGESLTTGAAYVTLLISNAGTVAQTYECDVSIVIEGNDYILSGLV